MQSQFKAPLRVALLCSIATCLAPQVAQAQAAEPPRVSSTAVVDELVVTARRREESLSDVPVSVSVATQEVLEERSITNPESLDKLDPALQILTAGGSRQSFSPAIRAQRGAASVITYFAEVPNFQPQFFDLQSIQVLKGPQGTLFGETATGGTLIYTPRAPSDEFEGYASAEAGNYGYMAFEGAVNLPIIRDLWSVRVAGQMRRRDGYTQLYFGQTGIAPTDADNLDTSDLRISSRFTPMENLEVSTVFAYSRSALNGTGYIKSGVYDYLPQFRTVPADNPATAARFQFFSGEVPPPGMTWLEIEQATLARQQALGPRVSFASNSQETDIRNYGVSNIVTWEILPSLTFKNITGFTTSTYGPNSGLNPDGSEYPVADNLGNKGGVCLQGLSPSNCREKGANNWTNEAQLTGDFLDGRLTAQGGFFYRKTTDAPWMGPSQFVVTAISTAFPAASCTAFGLPGTPCLTLTRTESESYAAYGQATYEVIPNVRLTAGVRRTWDQPIKTSATAGPVGSEPYSAGTIFLSPFGADPLPGATVTTTKSPKSTGTSYTFSADWQFAEDSLLWASHRRGYKGGGVNRQLATTDPNYAFGPETVEDWEIGVRVNRTLGGMPVSATLVGFNSKYDDIQRGTFGLVGTTYISFTQNVAEATIKGLEFSGAIEPVEWFQLSGSLAYTDASFDEWVDTTTCAREFYRAGCNGVPNATIPIVTDHVAGTVTANGVTEQFRPDVFSQAPELRWTLTPTLRLGFLGDATQGASLTANITHTSSYAIQDSNFTRGLAKKDVLAPSRTMVDLRFDWRDFSWTDADINLFAAVTNLTKVKKVVAVLDATSACDCVLSNWTEPRMWYAGVAYRF